MNLKNKKIAFLGDSITEGIGATNNYGYVNYISELSGADCSNFGISGSRIARQNKPTLDNLLADEDFCMRAERMDDDYDIIVIFGGSNDFGHGDAEFGVFSDRTPDTFYGALHTLYKTVIKMHPDSKIIVVTPIFRTDDEQISAIKGRSLKSYVLAIKEVAAVYNLPILNLFESEKSPYNPIFDVSLLADGLHPNDKGHKFLAECVINFLEKI